MKKASEASLKPALGSRPSRQEAEDAVRTLLAWAGDDPERSGLAKTPQRVVDAFDERFGGYRENAGAELARTFEDISGYSDMILLRDVRFESHCEHHIAPFTGVAHVAYVPNRRVVGLSRLARVVDIYARRLQEALAPKGVAVMIAARHQCMTLKAVNQPAALMVTSHFTGIFDTDAAWRDRVLRAVEPNAGNLP